MRAAILFLTIFTATLSASACPEGWVCQGVRVHYLTGVDTGAVKHWTGEVMRIFTDQEGLKQVEVRGRQTSEFTEGQSFPNRVVRFSRLSPLAGKGALESCDLVADDSGRVFVVIESFADGWLSRQEILYVDTTWTPQQIAHHGAFGYRSFALATSLYQLGQLPNCEEQAW